MGMTFPIPMCAPCIAEDRQAQHSLHPNTTSTQVGNLSSLQVTEIKQAIECVAALLPFEGTMRGVGWDCSRPSKGTCNAPQATMLTMCQRPGMGVKISLLAHGVGGIEGPRHLKSSYLQPTPRPQPEDTTK